MEAENQELREKVAELEQQVRDAQVAVDENERLRVLTGLVEAQPDLPLRHGRGHRAVARTVGDHGLDRQGLARRRGRE